MKQIISKLDTNNIRVESIDNSWNVTKSSLIKIFNKEKIWWWHCGNISKVDVKIGEKNRKFAVKDFKNWEKTLNHSLWIYDILKQNNVDTWTTYRKIAWKNSVLMTLWNKSWSLIFSSNNWSEDLKYLKENKIDNINNLDDFYNNSYLNIKKLIDANLFVYFDSYIFEYKNNDLHLIVWDFDEIKKNEKERDFLIANNIYEYCYALLLSWKYFKRDDDLFTQFAFYLLDQQGKNDLYLKNINLDKIFDIVLNLPTIKRRY